MSTDAKTRHSTEEYLTMERSAATKSEFFAGETFAMTGASQNHNLIVVNIGRELSLQTQRQEL
jgi:Uma2 family endonuclease